jgi:hypothetical protein
LTVGAREGYLSPFPDELVAIGVDVPAASSVATALASPVPTVGLPLHVHAAPFRHPSIGTFALLTAEIDASRFLAEETSQPSVASLEFSYIATDDRDRVYPAERHEVAFAFPVNGYEGRYVRVVSHIPLPPGRYQIRVAAGADGATGGTLYDLDVPRFDQALELSGVLLSASKSHALPTRILPSTTALTEGIASTPTTQRTFDREDVVSVYAEIYERIDSGGVTLTAEIINAGGSVLSRSVSRADRHDESVGIGLSIDLPLAGIQPGAYVLQVWGTSLNDLRTRAYRIPIDVE